MSLLTLKLIGKSLKLTLFDFPLMVALTLYHLVSELE